MTRARVAVLGIFVADLAFRAPRLPVMGETILGQGFKDGPGGKGSNQAIAAARAGAEVRMITRIGRDTFGEKGVLRCEKCGFQYPSVKDRMLKSPDDCPGCEVRAKFG